MVYFIVVFSVYSRSFHSVPKTTSISDHIALKPHIVCSQRNLIPRSSLNIHVHVYDPDIFEGGGDPRKGKSVGILKLHDKQK